MNREASKYWINSMLKALKDKDENLGKSVLEECGRQCCIEHGLLDIAKDLSEKSKNLSSDQKFLLIKKEFAKRDVSVYKESGMIYIEYEKCVCPIVNGDPDYNDFICECTQGFAKAFVETAFNRKAEFTLIKTILRGDDKCLLAVRII